MAGKAPARPCAAEMLVETKDRSVLDQIKRRLLHRQDPVKCPERWVSLPKFKYSLA